MSLTKGQGADTGSKPSDLNDLTDVEIVSPTNGQVLTYNSTTSLWEADEVPPSGGGTTIVSTSGLVSSNTTSKRPTVYFIFDDPQGGYKHNYDSRSIFTSRGFRFTIALRTDEVGGTFTYAMAREMQSEGFEFAYHGTKHNFPTTELVADINLYMSTVEPEGLNTQGYVGANGMWDEKIVFHTFFDTFKWGRGAGSSGVANIGDPVDYFKQVPTHFIDDLTSEANLTIAKAKIDKLFARGTGVLNLSMHWSTTHTPYLDNLLAYIATKGTIDVLTASEAYEVYGAVIELYDSSLSLTSDFTARGSSNGGTSDNVSKNHFILQKDGTILSNYAPVKAVTPLKGNLVLNGNSLADDFGFGITIVQYGSSDNATGFPGQGTLYNFNLGKNPAQQFQLFKAYNKRGIYYRENDTANAWRTSMASNKLGVFISPVPAGINAIGEIGDFSADANYVYTCYATNSWIRVAKDSTWTKTV